MTILGQGGDGIDEIQDEGISLLFHHALNLVGAGVTATEDAVNDRILITIPGGAGVTDHAALTNLAYAVAAHTGFGGTGIANTWAALQTFSVGLKLAAGQAIQDSGGAARLTLATASPHVALTGNLDVSGFMAVGNDAAVSAVSAVNISHDYALGSFGIGYGLNIAVNDIGSGAVTAFFLFGISGSAINKRSVGNLNTAAGLNFEAHTNATGTFGTLTNLHAMRLATNVNSAVGAVTNVAGIYTELKSTSGSIGPTNLRGLQLVYDWQGTAPTNHYAIDIPALTVGTNRYGIRMGDITGGAINRLLELGPATPNLRLEGGAPAANLSQLLIAVNNGAVVLRRIEIGAAGSAGAGFRTLRVAD